MLLFVTVSIGVTDAVLNIDAIVYLYILGELNWTSEFLTLSASARAYPPPRTKTGPHGSFVLTVSQSISASTRLARPVSTTNS